MYDILIKNGTCYDGSGAEPFQAHLAIQDGIIAAIGIWTPGEAARTIDASGLADTAGNVSYRMATFFIAFLLMLAVTGIVLRFYNDKGWRQMKRGCPRTGNTARLFVLLYAAVEIVMDSTRYDSPLMHFRILSDLNQFSAFISLAQVFAGFTVLGILIHFTRCSVRCNGFRWYHIPVWLGFFACAFVIGKLGEYNVQRYADYLRCYAWMSGGCLAMVALVWSLYRSCVSPRDLY